MAAQCAPSSLHTQQRRKRGRGGTVHTIVPSESPLHARATRNEGKGGEGKSKVSVTRRVTVFAYKHERKRIVSVRVRVRRRTGGDGGLSEGREWGPVVSSRVRVRAMVGVCASCRRRCEEVVVDSEEEARGRVGEGMSSSSRSG